VERYCITEFTGYWSANEMKMPSWQVLTVCALHVRSIRKSGRHWLPRQRWRLGNA